MTNTRQVLSVLYTEEKHNVHVHTLDINDNPGSPFYGVETRALVMQGEPTPGNEVRFRLICKNEIGADGKPLEARLSSSEVRHVQSALFRQDERGMFLLHRGWVAIGTLREGGEPAVDLAIAFSPLYKVETPPSTWYVPIVSDKCAWTFKAQGNMVKEDVTKDHPVWQKFITLSESEIVKLFAAQHDYSVEQIEEWIAGSYPAAS